MSPYMSLDFFVGFALMVVGGWAPLARMFVYLLAVACWRLVAAGLAVMVAGWLLNGCFLPFGL